MNEPAPLSTIRFEQAVRDGERAVLAHIAEGARSSEILARIVDVLELLIPRGTCVAVSSEQLGRRIVAAGARARERGATTDAEFAPMLPTVRRMIVDEHNRACTVLVLESTEPTSALEELALERFASLASVAFRRERSERARLDTWPVRKDSPSGRAIRTRVAGLAHEIRNALFGVAATLDAFDERFTVSLEHARYVGVIREEIGRVATLMQAFLDHGDPRVLREAPMSMREVLDAARAACQSKIEAYDVALSIEVEPGLPPLRLDRTQLVQVFRDVIVEAVQCSPAGGAVRVVARRSDEPDGTHAICDVLDEGSRCAEVDASALQEPFFTKRRGSNGHAMASAHRTLGKLGGTIEAGNRAENGRVVRVKIPL